MKSEKIILKFLGCQFQDLDLCAHLKTNGRIATSSTVNPAPDRTASKPLPASRIRAHASRAIPPVALGIELKSSGMGTAPKTETNGCPKRLTHLQLPIS